MSTPGMSNDETLELLGAYALGALDESERARVDELLAKSASARAELARYDHALGALTDAEATTTLPAGSWDRLRSALHADDANVGDEAAIATGLVAGLPADDSPDVSPEDGADLPPLRLPPRQPEGATGVVVPLRPRRRVALLLASAAALVAVGLVVGTLVRRTGGDRLADVAKAARTAPGSVHGSLATTDGVTLEAVVDAQGNGYLFADRLPALPEGRTYQLWSLDGPAPVSLGLMGNRPGLVTFPTGGQVRSLAVSAERSPGVTQPTNPIASGTLS